MILEAKSLSTAQASTPTQLPAGLSPSSPGPVIPSQVNGHSSGPDAHGGKALREDLQEFLGQEAPLHLLDDLTKVNPVTLETGMGLPLLKSALSKRVALWCRYSAQLPLTRPRQAGLLTWSQIRCVRPAWQLHLGSPTPTLLQIWHSS